MTCFQEIEGLRRSPSHPYCNPSPRFCGSEGGMRLRESWQLTRVHVPCPLVTIGGLRKWEPLLGLVHAQHGMG